MKNNIRKPHLILNNIQVEETICQRYLGLVLDQRLTFKFHAQDRVETAEKKLRILKRLTGTLWGTSKDTLKLTYMKYIHPVLSFGEEVMICASETVNKKLEVVQNKALRVITGGVKSCPILAMQMFSEIKSIKFSREQAAVKMYERIIRIPNNLWKNYTPAENQLKSKVSFLHRTIALYEKFNIEPPNKIRKFTFTKKRKNYFNKYSIRKAEISKKFEEEILAHYAHESQNKKWTNINDASITSKHRKIYVANFRKFTNHDLLYKHLAKLKIVESPLCILCRNEEQTSEHLLTCTGLTVERNKTFENDEELFSHLYWHVRNIQ